MIISNIVVLVMYVKLFFGYIANMNRKLNFCKDLRRLFKMGRPLLVLGRTPQCREGTRETIAASMRLRALISKLPDVRDYSGCAIAAFPTGAPSFLWAKGYN